MKRKAAVQKHPVGQKMKLQRESFVSSISDSIDTRPGRTKIRTRQKAWQQAGDIGLSHAHDQPPVS
jgi:hypothetical protein